MDATPDFSATADLEVAAILDSVASFQEEQELTKEQADAIEKASKLPPSKTKGRRLPCQRYSGRQQPFVAQFCECFRR